MEIVSQSVGHKGYIEIITGVIGMNIGHRTYWPYINLKHIHSVIQCVYSVAHKSCNIIESICVCNKLNHKTSQVISIYLVTVQLI